MCCNKNCDCKKERVDDFTHAQALAWRAISKTLDRVTPDWYIGDETGLESAVRAIERLAIHGPRTGVDWSKAPNWAQYAAQDADGVWYWYERKPGVHPGSFAWHVNGWSSYERCGGEPNPEFKKTLQRRSKA